MRRVVQAAVGLVAMLMLALPVRAAEATASCEPGDVVQFNQPSGTFAVGLDWAIAMAPKGGILRFAVRGTGTKPAEVEVCTRWRPDAAAVEAAQKKAELADAAGKAKAQEALESAQRALVQARRSLPWSRSATLALESASTDANIYTLTVPDFDGVNPLGFPVLEFRIFAPGGPAAGIDVVKSVTVTHPLFAGFFTVLVLAAALAGLYEVGRRRGLPGSDPFIKVISDRDGYASLSQAQMMLWTFLIGGASVYVLLLNGSLVNISTNVLYLLGISGLVVVGAKLQDAPAGKPALTNLPTAVTNLELAVDGAPAAGAFGGESALLSWRPPPGEWRSLSYVVHRQKVVAAGETAPPAELVMDRVRRSSLLVTGLRGASWKFIVAAVNGAGQGPDVETAVAFKGLDPEADVADNPKPAGFAALSRVDGPSIGLSWSARTDVSGWKLRWRRRGSDARWTAPLLLAPTADRFQVDGLVGGELYDFELRAVKAGADGAAATADAYAGPREPLWSDLVVFDEASGEINVTRVQMLFFTVAIACYVVLGVLRTQVIQEIPESMMLLMGISNGVYITARLVPRR